MFCGSCDSLRAPVPVRRHIHKDQGGNRATRAGPSQCDARGEITFAPTPLPPPLPSSIYKYSTVPTGHVKLPKQLLMRQQSHNLHYKMELFFSFHDSFVTVKQITKGLAVAASHCTNQKEQQLQLEPIFHPFFFFSVL